ncbi:hypothetical protein ASF23_11850 [Curtobacterium sp. Leaf261]|nr:hypothetical protein ASF23_11850 [Curtobacterium sp. Leaf261]
MLIAEDRQDSRLLSLLYARDAWGISPSTPLPETLLSKPRPQPSQPGIDRATLTARWDDDWQALMNGFRARPDDTSFSSFSAWVRALPQSWALQFEDVWDDVAFESWRDEISRPGEGDFAPTVIPDLIGAWRRGLRSITVLPFAADWVVPVGTSELFVSQPMRDDAEAFGRVLRDFG